jgi:hypothetical protein
MQLTSENKSMFRVANGVFSEDYRNPRSMIFMEHMYTYIWQITKQDCPAFGTTIATFFVDIANPEIYWPYLGATKLGDCGLIGINVEHHCNLILVKPILHKDAINETNSLKCVGITT